MPGADAAPDPLETWPWPDWLAAVEANPGYDWARKAWRRAAAVPDAWYDAAKAEAVVARWPEWFRLTEDRFAGKPFRLAVWQAIVVRLLVGWKIPTPILDETTGEPRIVWVRLFRRLRLWIPRKNGKSEFLAALALLFWAHDAVMRGQGYVFARKEKQAKIVFNKMKAMIGYSPELADRVSVFAKSLFVKTHFSPFELLPGTAEGTHGASPTVSVWDEIHEAKPVTVELADNIRQGMGARQQPMELHASTAGLKSNFAGKGQFDDDVSRLEGRLDDPTTLVVIFALAPEADPFDEANWPIANPSLGLGLLVQFLRLEAAEARGNPRAEARFRCYHLNQWVDGVVRWLPVKKWDSCAATTDGWTKYPQTLQGRLCYGAIDLSSTRDITALVLLFPPTDEDEKWRVLARFWVPKETLEERVREDGVPYDKWALSPARVGSAERDDAGQTNILPALETTDGDAVDQNAVAAALIEARGLYDLQGVAYDPWCAHKLVMDLQNEHGIDAGFFREFRQGVRSFAEPSREFEKLVFKGLLDHGGHPVLRWMAQNAAIRFDDNLNFMPAKKKSAEKIDGIVAGVMALGMCMAAGEAPGASYLEEEDAEVLML